MGQSTYTGNPEAAAAAAAAAADLQKHEPGQS